MIAAGLPDFGPVQNNISFNDAAGTTRGIHAEPWDKWVSIASGRIFGAWVDLRSGPTFGAVFTAELDPSRAVFVPAVSATRSKRWSPTRHTSTSSTTTGPRCPVHLGQPRRRDGGHTMANPVGAGGVIGQGHRSSAVGRRHARAAAQDPRPWRRWATGPGAARQLRRFTGRRIRRTCRHRPRRSGSRDRAALARLRHRHQRRRLHRRGCGRDPDGRTAAWACNVTGVAALARIARAHAITLVHVSSDYVFDGTAEQPYREDDPVSLSASTGRPRPRAIRSWAPCRATTSCARRGSSVRAETSCAP